MAVYRLALDIGTATGWALAADHRIIASGTMLFQKKPKDHPGKRLNEFWNWLAEKWSPLSGDCTGVQEVFYEEVIGFSGHTDSNLFQRFYGQLERWAYLANVPLSGIHPVTLKHRFTGSGRAKKIDVCRTALNLGWPNGEVGTDRFHDEADAVALLVVVLQNLDKEAVFDYGY